MARQAMPVQTGDVIDYKNSGEELIAVGSIVPMGNFCGVAEVDIAPGDTGAVCIVGVWEVDSVSSAVFTVGLPIYWDAANTRATNSATGNTPLGMCVAPKASGGTKARVKIGMWFPPAATVTTGS
ncbi:MAG: DUF2190 family protein [Fretibacterium sp.]|nr:DUF2190 family protein [Fretibacterium sp.]